MLSRNPGLKELCHSITGGALVAQGYWIPYDAAKAMAATFCWHIRYALTPVFGKAFPELCLPPDSENFGSMQIDPEITKRCALQARHYRELENLAASGPSSGISSPQTSQTPQTPKVRPQLRMILPKPYKETDTQSEYSTDTSREDKYELSSPSPQIAFTNPWSAVNTPRSPPKISFDNPWSPSSTTRSSSPCRATRKGRTAANIPRSHTPLDLLPPPRRPLFPATPPNSVEADKSVLDMSPRSAAEMMEVDEDYDAGSDDSEDSKGQNNVAARKKSSRGFTDTKAAYILMKLKTQGEMFKADEKSLKPVELTGFELQVADAATKAGFNTFNHEALFNLIWVVKRLALQAGTLHPRGRLPKDPIYPDRYRPNGIGDNTKKKSRAVTIQPPANHTVELKFHPIQPLMRKRPLHDIKEENLIDLTLSSDSERDPTDLRDTPFKRQKVLNGSKNPNVGGPRVTYPNSLQERNEASTSIGIWSKPKSHSARKRENRRSRSAAAIAVAVVPKAPPAPEDQISKQLHLVKTKLDDVRQSMNTCQATMKALFDVHYEKFDSDKMMEALQKLSGFMNKVYDGGKEGAEEAEKAIALLGDNKDGIL
ncbi:hypothetical protein CLAIMM_05071 isoform 2 [Cladophialophora immunda]|nr:hypothetical protein CLAIMM_05071 isoform 2 [Cladophialophora immunda]